MGEVQLATEDQEEKIQDEEEEEEEEDKEKSIPTWELSRYVIWWCEKLQVPNVVLFLCSHVVVVVVVLIPIKSMILN